jgi:hypothetical protein
MRSLMGVGVGILAAIPGTGIVAVVEVQESLNSSDA